MLFFRYWNDPKWHITSWLLNYAYRCGILCFQISRDAIIPMYRHYYTDWIWRINLVYRQQKVLEVQLCEKNCLVNFTRNSLNLNVISRKLALKSLIEYFICVVSSLENKIYISHLIRRQVKLCLMNCIMTGIGRIFTHWMNAPCVKIMHECQSFLKL